VNKHITNMLLNIPLLTEIQKFRLLHFSDQLFLVLITLIVINGPWNDLSFLLLSGTIIFVRSDDVILG
jgi:hypothetical protein